jgi:hypothetical protein
LNASCCAGSANTWRGRGLLPHPWWVPLMRLT